MQFPNGAGYHDYEDVPRNLYEEESNININDDVLCESESVVSRGHDHLPHEDGGRDQSPLQAGNNS